MLAALLERQAGGPTEELLKLYWNRAGRQTRGQGAPPRAVRAARQAQGAGGRDPARARAARRARAAADEPAGGGQRDGLLPAAPSVARRRAAARAVRPRAANAAREARARAAAGRRDGQAAAAARSRQGKDRGARREAPRRGRRAGSPRAEAREHEQPSCACSARAPSSDRSRGCRAAGRCSRRSSRSCGRLPEKIQGEPLPEPEGLSLDSRRLINTAIIALAQHLVRALLGARSRVAREDVDRASRRRHEVRRPPRLRPDGRAHSREDRGAEAAEDASPIKSSGGRICCSPRSSTATTPIRCRASSRCS